MKVMLLIACALLAVQATLAVKGPVAEPVCDAICPLDNPIVENWHLPYTGDCTKFCHCANDGNWKKDCPGGLHFNKDLQVCDWPNSAGCEDGSAPPSSEAPATTTTAPTSSEAPVITTTASSSSETPVITTPTPGTGCNDLTCEKDDCFHVKNTIDCQKYCDCDHGTIIIKECSDGLFFNPKTGNCDWEKNVECEESEVPPTSTQAPTTEDSSSGDICDEVCLSAEPKTYLPYPGDCSKFCACSVESNWEKSCPAGLYFNEKLQVCDWPDSAGCDDGETPVSSDAPVTTEAPTTTEAPVSSTDAPISTTEGSSSGGSCDDVCPDVFPIEDNNHLPFPGNCSKFCHCANNGNWEKDCPPGLHFNKDLQVCDWPSSAGCEEDSGPTSSETPVVSSETPTTTEASASTEAAGTTDAPASTDAPVVTTEAAGSDGSCDNVCPNVFPIEDNNHLPYPGDCSKFCHCANDGNWEKDCPPGLHFNKDLQVCDWPGSAGCDDGTKPSSETPVVSSEAPVSATTEASGITDAPASTDASAVTTEAAGSTGTCDDVCPDVFPIEDNNHLSLPGDCTKFCHCANDGNWEKDCPSGLHFNQALQVCDWPNDANCKA